MFKIKTIEGSWLIGIKGKLLNTTGYFIIDTGAQVSMINRLYFNAHNPVKLQMVEVMGISTNTIENIEIAKHIPIKLTRFKYTLKKALIMNISHVTDRFKPNYIILGLIGNDFLYEHSASLNYYDMVMSLDVRKTN
ncbi:MAG: hypothetical protein ACUVQP_03375 [Bacteroidales bacterium]